MKAFSAVFSVFATILAMAISDRCEAQLSLVSGYSSPAMTQPSIANSLNGFIVYAPTGGDISASVNAALSAAASSCGTVTISPGYYLWENANIVMSACETLQGAGATILVKVEGPNPFLIVKGPTPPEPPNNFTYTIGSIRGLTFVGPSTPYSQSTSTGIGLGGTNSAETAQLFNLYDVHLRSFGCGVKVEWAHQIAFFGGSIEGNYDGICFADIITGLENFNFHGTQILNNVNYGINDNQTGINLELNLTDCSLDYNGQSSNTGGQIQMTNGKLAIMGGHVENVTMPMITVPAPAAPAIVNIYITGTAFNLADTNPTHSYASFLDIKGLNDVVEIGRGVSFYSQGAKVSAVANWAPIVNQNSRLLADPYTFSVSTIPAGLPAYVGTAPNNYSYASYDVHDNVTGIRSSFSSSMATSDFRSRSGIRPLEERDSR